jgi:hypothetical protein
MVAEIARRACNRSRFEHRRLASMPILPKCQMFVRSNKLQLVGLYRMKPI